jgi:hypothetical protein
MEKGEKIMKTWLYTLYIKFLNLLLGNGFRMVKPSEKEIKMYKYCKSIVNYELIGQIQEFEDEFAERLKSHPGLVRNDIAYAYVEALEEVYGREIKNV